MKELGVIIRKKWIRRQALGGGEERDGVQLKKMFFFL